MQRVVVGERLERFGDGAVVNSRVKHVDDQHGAGAKVIDALQGFGDAVAGRMRAELGGVGVVQAQGQFVDRPGGRRADQGDDGGFDDAYGARAAFDFGGFNAVQVVGGHGRQSLASDSGFGVLPAGLVGVGNGCRCLSANSTRV